MTLTPRALPTPHLSWAVPLPASIGGNGGWFYDLLRQAGVGSSLAHNLVEFLIRPLEIVLVALAAWAVARFGGKAIRRLITKMGSPAAERSSSPRAVARVQTTAGVIANTWRFAVAIFAIATVLGMLGIDLAPLLASATIIGATLGFGAQLAIRDYISGFLLTIEDQFGIGDTISVNDQTGTVEELGLRVTRFRAADGSLVYVPNGDIRLLQNASRGWAKAVVEVTVPVTSAVDLAKTTDVVAQAAAAVAREADAAAGCTQAPEVLGLVSSEGGQGTLRVMLRTNHTHRSVVERTLRGAIVGALADAGTWSATSPPTPAPSPEPAPEPAPEPELGPI